MFCLKSKSVATKAVVACLALLTVCFTAVAARVGWHGLQQSQRDMRILNRARQDNNRYVGPNCKEWARQVVRDASNGEVTLAPTKSNNYQWNLSGYPYIYAYPNLTCPPLGIAPGRIIQMVWRNRSNNNTNPHTAIVSSSNSSGMTWIESNWNNHDATVRTRFVPYTEFNQCVGTNYTVYEIR